MAKKSDLKKIPKTTKGKAACTGKKADLSAVKEITAADPRDGKEKRLSKETQIKRERARLERIMKDVDLDPKKRRLAAGLIGRAAFLRASLTELEEDIAENGYTELFSQSENQTPYERQRPNVNTYNSMNGNYQKIIKQLIDLLPKEQTTKQVEDDFADFVFDRK